MSTFGQILKVELFGESHGASIGATISNLPGGFYIDVDLIKDELKRRSPKKGESERIESDEFFFISGEMNSYTTGKPLTVIVLNKDFNNTDYDDLQGIPRPGSGDYVNYMKYGSFYNFYGGGHESGRLSVPLIIVGNICRQILSHVNIDIYSHIKSCNRYIDKSIEEATENELNKILCADIPVFEKEDEYLEVVEKAKLDQDSVGGIVECMITGLQEFCGESWFDSVQGHISQLMMSISGVKGIEFGLGFKFNDALGSMYNDTYYYDEKKEIHFVSNYDGGISAGITNHQPIIFRIACKPAPSIGLPQKTINLDTETNVTIKIKGRHDSTIVRKMTFLVSNLVAIEILDELLKFLGTDLLVNINEQHKEQSNK